MKSYTQPICFEGDSSASPLSIFPPTYDFRGVENSALLGELRGVVRMAHGCLLICVVYRPLTVTWFHIHYSRNRKGKQRNDHKREFEGFTELVHVYFFNILLCVLALH